MTIPLYWTKQLLFQIAYRFQYRRQLSDILSIALIGSCAIGLYPLYIATQTAWEFHTNPLVNTHIWIEIGLFPFIWMLFGLICYGGIAFIILPNKSHAFKKTPPFMMSELFLPLLITALLALTVTSIKAHRHYDDRATFLQSISFSLNLYQERIEKHYALTNQWPNRLDFINITEDQLIEYPSIIDNISLSKEGVIIIRYNEKALLGAHIYLLPTIQSDNKIKWECAIKRDEFYYNQLLMLAPNCIEKR